MRQTLIAAALGVVTQSVNLQSTTQLAAAPLTEEEPMIFAELETEDDAGAAAKQADSKTDKKESKKEEKKEEKKEVKKDVKKDVKKEEKKEDKKESKKEDKKEEKPAEPKKEEKPAEPKKEEKTEPKKEDKPAEAKKWTCDVHEEEVPLPVILAIGFRKHFYNLHLALTLFSKECLISGILISFDAFLRQISIIFHFSAKNAPFWSELNYNKSMSIK